MFRRRAGLVAVTLLIAVVAAAVTGVVAAQHSTQTVEVRIVAQRLDDGRVEFGLQQRRDGSWGERVLPRARFFPATGSGRWLSSSPVELTVESGAVALATGTVTAGPARWRGLVVAPEQRCSPYVSGDYRYPQSVEADIVRAMGGIIYGPYTGTWFASTAETDIEHIVARSEAHDSGLCAANAATRLRFARDLLNLTLPSPSVNRVAKSDRDAADWLPSINRCWYAARVVEVRVKYALTVDERERDALERILAGCASTAMAIDESGRETATPVSTQESPSSASALALYDHNGNGRITCAEARRHGIAPVQRGHPAYQYMDDRDNDGVVCE